MGKYKQAKSKLFEYKVKYNFFTWDMSLSE